MEADFGAIASTTGVGTDFFVFLSSSSLSEESLLSLEDSLGFVVDFTETAFVFIPESSDSEEESDDDSDEEEVSTGFFLVTGMTFDLAGG